MSDRLHDTLSTLQPDADRVPLAEATSVRRRGEQRTRRQAVGTALAAVVVIAAAVGVSSQLVGSSDRAVTPPAHSGTPTPATADLAADPVLRPADFGTVGPYTGWKQSPDKVDERVRPLSCISSPATLGADQVESASYYQDLDAHVVEHVLHFPDAAAAETAAAAPLAEFASCPTGDPAEATVVDRAVQPIPGLGAAASRASRLSTPTADSEPFYYELAVMRVSNVVVVLQWTSMGNPLPNGGWVWDSRLAQTAVDRALGWPAL